MSAPTQTAVTPEEIERRLAHELVARIRHGVTLGIGALAQEQEVGDVLRERREAAYTKGHRAAEVAKVNERLMVIELHCTKETETASKRCDHALCGSATFAYHSATAIAYEDIRRFVRSLKLPPSPEKGTEGWRESKAEKSDTDASDRYAGEKEGT